MFKGYADLVKEGAQKQKLTADQVRTMGEAEITALLGDKLQPGRVFDWYNVRRLVANALECVELYDEIERRRAAFQTAIQALPGESKTSVVLDVDGVLCVQGDGLPERRWDKPIVEPEIGGVREQAEPRELER